ncbi:MULTISPECIES: Fe(3+)-siderophore ABC transporter permease [Pseudomonas syringae group genomosp. 2]|uniref:Fe(3+)-siderophore ABC transporter permease n=4 Tax=Pseudomonas syringae group TaxID=136849 RepID=UPI0001CC26ED|nr:MULTISPECIES: Fe(3+)-siderophore ABC transporter permease [Pseudomonas syringae group genomosp. 2]EGH01691.1 iron-enterobactin transporter membrane protein [Pseudomonas amygdali pv. aesculi str. 0893_23]KWT10987.1 ABC transporter permease [Pseudomonas amygdali pv. aesculi]KWT20829.1 ABC transporter permease [Pseudomonas amygdali pv. aesculi]KWT28291.1 ABC transporter permease [Pseudomonas amygdali pv. aesculi]KWT31779.1 ABC transporter permease [Pseudomonas amygdali pv. aesculi]
MRTSRHLTITALALLAAILSSLQIGAHLAPLSQVMDALTGACTSIDCVTITDARVPRTLAGLLAGAALGVAGALMQTLTRNPLADPGILGINAGASFALVVGMAWLGVNSPDQYVVCAVVGALVANLLVTLSGFTGGGHVSPMRLTLMGVALTAVLEGIGSGISLLNPLVFDQVRYWQAGSLDVRNLELIKVAAIPIGLGVVLALSLSRNLDSLGMGLDMAAALGTRVLRTQLLGLLAITLLCGAATAIVGPIAFVGLMMPHLARRLAGPEHARQLPFTLLLTPTLLLLADTLGRVIATNELRVSVMTAFVGAPVLIWLARRRRLGAS